MRVLGVETSCDETAAAVVACVSPEARLDVCGGVILGQAVYAQFAEHAEFGGVVPEIAARAHLDHIDEVIERAVAESGIALGEIDAIAATSGPGLIGGVIVGATVGKALALALGQPFIAVNHLEAHALTVRLTADVPFPYLLLLVSGGHCQLLAVEGVGRYRVFGTTIDDAVGEAFDKTAKLLDLGFPGGPAVERAARGRDPNRFSLPRPMLGRPGCDFSFSGLKTAVRLAAQNLSPSDLDARGDLAAAFQQAVSEVLADRAVRAMRRFRETHPGGTKLVLVGGVAANQTIRDKLSQSAAREGFELLAPPPGLCTDNGAMVAWAGIERLRLGLVDGLDSPVRPRWPLDANARRSSQAQPVGVPA